MLLLDNIEMIIFYEIVDLLTVWLLLHLPLLDSGIILGFAKDKVIFLKLQASVSELCFPGDWFSSSCLPGFPSFGKARFLLSPVPFPPALWLLARAWLWYL